MAKNRRLDTWKEIGSFLGRNERTAKRWELERGLPIRRVPGGPRGRIYAYSDDLTTWLENALVDPPFIDEFIPSSHNVGTIARERHLAQPLLLWLSLAALLILLTTTYLSLRSLSAPARPPSEMERYGNYEWSRRTPESLLRAVDAYTQAIVADPGDARAFAGLARCYILLREFSVMPDAVAYPKAEAAARRAIALDGTIADAHATLGFVEFYSSWKFASGLQEFQRAIALEPYNGTWRQWFANALSTLGNSSAAKREIDRAEELDPNSAALMADRARIYFMSGDRPAAFKMLRTLEQNEPNLTSSHIYMANFLEEIGDDRGYLRELASAGASRRDADLLAVAAAGERGFAIHGRKGLFASIIKERTKLFQMGRGDQFHLAEAYAATGDAQHAVAALQFALKRREPTLLGVKTEHIFRSIAEDPKYISVVKAVGL